MLRRRHHAKAQVARETEGRQKTNEVFRVGKYSSRSVYRGAQGMTLQWFSSGTVRHATAMRKHVQKILNHQRDILSPPAIDAVQAAIAELQKCISEKADKEFLTKQMDKLEGVANKWLKPYPNAAWREN